MPFCMLTWVWYAASALVNSLESLIFDTTIALERSALNSWCEFEGHIHIPHSFFISMCLSRKEEWRPLSMNEGMVNLYQFVGVGCQHLLTCSGLPQCFSIPIQLFRPKALLSDGSKFGMIGIWGRWSASFPLLLSVGLTLYGPWHHCVFCVLRSIVIYDR